MLDFVEIIILEFKYNKLFYEYINYLMIVIFHFFIIKFNLIYT